METVFSSDVHDSDFLQAARDLGNSIQASLTEDQNAEMLTAAGFSEPRIVDDYEVEADRGYKAGETVRSIEGDSAKYRAVCLHAIKQ